VWHGRLGKRERVFREARRRASGSSTTASGNAHAQSEKQTNRSGQLSRRGAPSPFNNMIATLTVNAGQQAGTVNVLLTYSDATKCKIRGDASDTTSNLASLSSGQLRAGLVLHSTLQKLS